MEKLSTFMLAVVLFGFSFSVELVKKESRFSGEDTVRRIVEAVREKGLKVFAVIDHRKAAKEFGLRMPFEKVIVFGNPKVGTRFMLEKPEVGVELPLRILVYEKGGKTFIVYKSPASIEKEYGLERFHQFFVKLSENLDRLTDRLVR
ncbi:DUF302 domain-containing protein [Hydrogenivirga sp.]